MQSIYTVGHSTHAVGTFISLLQKHGITTVCDVRSTPHSQYNPQFNSKELKASLRQHRIAYVFLGAELGARSEDRNCYLHGIVQYERLAQTELFRSGIQRLQNGAEEHRIVLMCAEKEPLECHRTILVARHLVSRGCEVQHIHADGHLESHPDALTRLANMLNLREAEYHLFRTHQDLLDDAYRLQEKRIAYDSDTAKPEVIVAGAE